MPQVVLPEIKKFNKKDYRQMIEFEFNMEDIISSLKCITPIQRIICSYIYRKADDLSGISRQHIKLYVKPTMKYLANKLNVNYYDLKKHLKAIYNLPFVEVKSNMILFKKPTFSMMQALNVSLDGRVTYESLEKTQPVNNKNLVIRIYLTDISYYYKFLFTQIDQQDAAQNAYYDERDVITDEEEKSNYQYLPEGHYFTLNFSCEANRFSGQLARSMDISHGRKKVFTNQKAAAKTYVLQKNTSIVHEELFNIQKNYNKGSVYLELHQTAEEHVKTRNERYRLYRDSMMEVDPTMVPRFEDKKKLTDDEKKRVKEVADKKKKTIEDKKAVSTFSKDVKDVIKEYGNLIRKKDGEISYTKLCDAVKSILIRSGENAQFGVNKHGEVKRIKNLVKYFTQFKYFRDREEIVNFIMWSAYHFKKVFYVYSKSKAWYPEILVKKARIHFEEYQREMFGEVREDMSETTCMPLTEETSDAMKILHEYKERRKKKKLKHRKEKK